MSEAGGIVPPARLRVWDWPTRLFHWLLVPLIPALWWTAEYGRIELHVTLGLAMLALLLFRLIWGVIGSSTARFANFLKGPRGVLGYLNGRAAHALGHNPLGGWSVAAMLALLCIQVGLGLFASDEDGIVTGPLFTWVEVETSEWATQVHHLLFNALLALIALHIAAILFYTFFKRQKLVQSMITGRGDAAEGTAPMRPAPAWRLLLAAVIAVGTAAWLWTKL